MDYLTKEVFGHFLKALAVHFSFPFADAMTKSKQKKEKKKEENGSKGMRWWDTHHLSIILRVKTKRKREKEREKGEFFSKARKWKKRREKGMLPAITLSAENTSTKEVYLS